MTTNFYDGCIQLLNKYFMTSINYCAMNSVMKWHYFNFFTNCKSFTLQLYTNYTTSLGKASFSLVVKCASGKSIKSSKIQKTTFKARIKTFFEHFQFGGYPAGTRVFKVGSRVSMGRPGSKKSVLGSPKIGRVPGSRFQTGTRAHHYSRVPKSCQSN